MLALLPDWIRHYQRRWLALDLVAGLTAGAVVIPKALAYATIAGLPVQVGLYTVFVPMLIYAWFGSSRPLSVSTTTTLAILTATALSQMQGTPVNLATAAATLMVLVGLILVLAGLLRLGFVANFISEPVLVGFKAGIGVVIVLDQLPKLLGIHIHKGSFLHNLQATVAGIPQASLATVALALVMIAVLVALRRFTPRLPAPLVVVALGIGCIGLLGFERFGIATVGAIPSGLPQLTWPDWPLVLQLWPAAMGIALMSFTETIAAARAFAQSDEPSLQPNRELLATGLANLGGAFFGAMPAGGGTTQTAVNRLAGAHSQLAGLITALLALAALLLLGPVIGLMPEATLAAVVIVYSMGLIQPSEFRDILKVRKTEFIWALVAFLGVMLLGTLQGILVAIVVSLLALAYQVSDPPVHVLRRKPHTNVFRPQADAHPNDEAFPGLLMLRPEGRLFFANAERVGQKIVPLIAAANPKVVVLDLSRVFDVEYTALRMLTDFERRQQEKGISVWLAGLNPSVSAMLIPSPLGQTLGPQRLFYNLEQVIVRYAPSPSEAVPPA
ncbi:SulP family sulfate permease [Pseudomonas sp. TE3786]